jgi:hypothetical protein
VDDSYLSATFRPTLRIRENEETGEEMYYSMKLKLPKNFKSGLLPTAYDMDGNVVDIDENLLAKTSVTVFARPQKIFFLGVGKVGVTWVVEALKISGNAVFKPTASMFSESDDEADHEAGASGGAVAAPVLAVTEDISQLALADAAEADDEAEDAEEPEPVEEPAEEEPAVEAPAPAKRGRGAAVRKS